MAAPNSAASKKAAKAGTKKASNVKPGIKKNSILKPRMKKASIIKPGFKKASIFKSGIKKSAKKTSIKAPATSAKSTIATKKTLKTPTQWTGRLKSSPGTSKKTPAPAKKASKSTLRKTGSKMIKKTLGKKGKEMSVKGSAKKTLGGAGKSGGVAAFDLEAFVKVKFSDLEKTAHQKKVKLNVAFIELVLSSRMCPDRPTARWRS